LGTSALAAGAVFRAGFRVAAAAFFRAETAGRFDLGAAGRRILARRPEVARRTAARFPVRLRPADTLDFFPARFVVLVPLGALRLAM
jgi:hypothetical protein